MRIRRIRFDVGVAATVLMLVAVPIAVTFAIVWSKSGTTASEVAGQLFSDKAALVEVQVKAMIDGATALVDGGVELPQLQTPPEDGAEWPAVPVLRRILANNAKLYSFFVGYRDGRFLQVIPVRDPAQLKAHDAPPGTAEIDRALLLRHGQRVQSWRFLDADHHVVSSREDLSPSYDPRARVWWNDAGASLSAPYLFDSVQKLGLTISRPLPGGQGVVGADLTLEGLSRFIEDQTVSPAGAVFLLDRDGRVLATPKSMHSDLPPLGLVADSKNGFLSLAASHAVEGEGRVYRAELQGKPMLALFSSINTGRMVVGVVAPEADFTAHIDQIALWVLSVTALVLALAFPVVIFVVRMLSRRLTQLSEEAERITEMDFSGVIPQTSLVLEFHQLGRAFAMMKNHLLSRTRTLETAQSKLVRLLDIGIAMGSEKDMGSIIEMVVTEAERNSGAEGGTLFLLTEDGKSLRFEFMHNKLLDILVGGAGDVVDFELPTIPFIDPASGEHDLRNVVCAAIHRGQSINVRDVYGNEEFDFSTVREFDRRTGYQTKTLLVVPLRPRGGEVIGAIQLVNAHEKGGDEATAFSFGVQRHVESLAAQAANALYNRILLDAQDKLVDAMVKIIAGAIDAKSPYTGGHCERVPLLAQMLAEEATNQTEGPLADFRFTTDDEWREFRFGAWLHDCGKVTTPEYVVDKATKLETIHNRIHEIRTRFELLLRDAEITRLKAVAGGADEDGQEALFQRRKLELEQDFAFIAECNIGGEFMAAEKVERLQSIARQQWLRYFDDRLGLSYEEKDRMDLRPKPQLPVWEPLLSDRPEQIIPWSGKEKFTQPEWQFTQPVPAVMYNRGEVYNLSIARGTLTEEERFKVSEHVIQTLMMLESMPFPKHLRRVPEYAGTHHEAMNGRGYPRSLTEKDLSVPTRIMAIADVFEALTASDRPYKKAKPLSVCVDILAEFRDNGHIDPVLFELFLKSGIYRRYAERHLMPHQLDEVDISKYFQETALS